MFEISVALKYLTPRWRQLSVSIISMISILVISLVVWLVVVFFSVTHGLENMWTDRLVALTAPLRITPTEAYYQSYYYKADSISGSSEYTTKNLSEKLIAEVTNPYNPSYDEEIPRDWPNPDLDGEGQVKDLVKLAWGAVEEINDVEGVSSHDYEMTGGSLKLRLIREGFNNLEPLRHRPMTSQSFISQPSYIGTFDGSNPSLSKSMTPISMADLTNALRMVAVSSENIQEDSPDGVLLFNPEIAQTRLQRFFDTVTIKELKTPSNGWILPPTMLPSHGYFDVVILSTGDQVKKVLLPSRAETIPSIIDQYKSQELQAEKGHMVIRDKEPFILQSGAEFPILEETPLMVEGETRFPVTVHASSINHATTPQEITFEAALPIQGITLHGEVPFRHLEIGDAHVKKRFAGTPSSLPFWVFQTAQPDGSISQALPSGFETGEGILLPKQYREAGVLVADRGYLSYLSPTSSSVQEQRIPITVMGFYDPGILPIGGKLVLANRDLVSSIRASQNPEDLNLSNGINVRFPQLKDADRVKSSLLNKFASSGIDKYWKVETYMEYEFTKDLLQQLRSERNIWSLIAGVIIIVACSNIISMLIILVNDKKTEIGILRSMGATSRSIALIFGTCGIVMGLIGSLFGMLIALFTLHHLNTLVGLISRMQGYEAFNPLFYGDNLPNTVSGEAVSFVLIATIVTSLIAGIVPAVKASMLRPSTILRSE